MYDINATIGNSPNPYVCPAHGAIQGHYTTATFEGGKVITRCCRCRRPVSANPEFTATILEGDDFADLLADCTN